MDYRNIGNNNFIDARSRVKTSFILAIIAGVFSLFCINHYANSYKLQTIFTHLIKIDGQDYTTAFVDMLWLVNVLCFVSAVAMIAVLCYCRFKWCSKYLIAIPAGLKLVCSVLLVFVIYSRNYKLLIAQEGVYEIKDIFLITGIIYILAHLFIFISIFLPGKVMRPLAVFAIVLLTGVGIISFFAPAPYAIPYTLVVSGKEAQYQYLSYRALSAQIAEFVLMFATFFMAHGLGEYHKFMKEDAAAEN